MTSGGPWLTILELFRWIGLSQGSRTLESSGCSDSNEKHRDLVVACAQVPFGNPLPESGSQRRHVRLRTHQVLARRRTSVHLKREN